MTVPRFTSVPFPPYSYVPGRFPHPHSDPAGHRFAPQGDVFLLGVDLFNHGYYWEAHEAWEAGWHDCGRRGGNADFLKGLIQLAVSGVKIRQAMSDSAAAHARRAAELLHQVRVATKSDQFMGLDISVLAQYAERIADEPPTSAGVQPVEVLFAFALMPQ